MTATVDGDKGMATREPVRVLLIEDNPGDARLIDRMFGDAGVPVALHMADCLTAGIEHLRRQSTDVVLLDLGLPESTGLDTLRRLLAEDILVPALVVLSGLADEETAMRALDAGAQDYLVKGEVDGPAIARSVRFAISRIQASTAARPAKTQSTDERADAGAAGRYALYVNLTCELESQVQVRRTLDELAATLPEAVRVRSWSVWSPSDDITMDVVPQERPAPGLPELSVARPPVNRRKLH